MNKLPREHFENEAERAVPYFSGKEREAWIDKCYSEHPGFREAHDHKTVLHQPWPMPPQPEDKTVPVPAPPIPDIHVVLPEPKLDISLWVWRALVLLALVFLCVSRAHGQVPGPGVTRRTDPVVGPVVIRFANTNPSGNACTFGSPIQYFQGTQYVCANGTTYSALVGGGGSGCTLGGVTSQALVYNNAGTCNGVGFGTAGQILTSQGAGAVPAMADPIVSYNYTTLLNAVAATGTQTGSAVRIPLLSAYGSLAIQGASISGSPSGCTIALQVQTNIGTPLSSNIASQAFTPANSYQSFSITPSAGFNGADQMVAIYACSVYPGAGTITAVWEPAFVTANPFALPTGANTIGAVTQASGPWTQNLTQVGGSAIALGQTTMSASVPVAIASNQSAFPVSQSGAPWSQNVTQFGGANISTGTGAGGTGIPRVTVSNDSSLAANQSVNVNQIGGTNVVTGGASGLIAVAGPVASGASNADNPVKIGGVFNTTQPTVTNGQEVDLQATARGAAIVATGVDAFAVNATQTGTWTVQPGNTPNTSPWLVQGNLSNNGAAAGANRIGALDGIAQTSYNNGTATTQGRDVAANYGTDGLLWTAWLPAMRPASYTASSKFAASSTTDNSCMPGNATNTVLVTELRVSGIQTTAGMLNVEVSKRSAADTGGTSANMTAVPDDSNYAAASSQPVSYTGTGPTAGSAVGDVDNAEVGFMATATASPNDIYIANWRQKPIVLRGTAQNICINLGNAAVTGGTMTVTWKWIETTTITP